MINQVITINGKKYAVGLFWQPIGTSLVSHNYARNYARNLSRTVDKKLNLFTEYRAMVALGSRKLGHSSGMPSAAAEVIDALTEYTSFLTVFPIGKLFYLVAVRNGVVLEDEIFEKEEDARAEYSKLSEIPDWSALVAPENWAMPRAIERNLSDLVSGNAHAVLRPISKFRGAVLSITLLVIFILLALYFFRKPIDQIWHNAPSTKMVENPELAAEYEKQIEEKNRELDKKFEIAKTPEPQPIAFPYDNLPTVKARAKLCYQAIGFLMQPIPGWVQTWATCSENEASAQLKRSFGTLADFYNVATNLMSGAFVSEESEDSLLVQVTLPTLKTSASLDEHDAETVLRSVLSNFQAVNMPVDAGIFLDTITNGVDTINLNVVKITAKSKLVPMEFMQIFNDFEGVYMSQCEWNAVQRIWNYEVMIYAK